MNMPFIRSFPIVMRLSEEENVTENLKATAPMEWVKRSNNIRNRADEIVNRELIFLNAYRLNAASHNILRKSDLLDR